jgi:pimeloyl-ACP methyl ester carboxylesterase
VIESSTNAVTRELIGVDFGELESATRGRLSSWFYLHPSELGVPVEDVLIPTPVGEAPAWLVAAEETSSAWAILVHGRAVTRQETIRAIPTLRAAGYTTLSVSYRNDGEAPPSSDGRYALGDAEWQDVDAAIKYAVEHGATDLVIVGYSMGGAITLQTATRSEYAELVRGVVLDSPVIDWRNVIDAQGAALHIPGLVRDGAVGLIGGSWAGRVTGLDEPVDFARLDFVKRAADLIGPILILASDDDDYVPPGPAKSLAAARPDIVTLELFEGAGHVRLWNYDEERWTGVVSRWIAALPSAAR